MKFCCIAKTSALIAGLMTVVLSLSVQQTNAESFLDKLNKKLEQANVKIQKNTPNQPASGQDQTPATQQSETASSRNDAPNAAPRALAKNSSSAPSVAGIRLGMTASEAVAALKAFDPKLEITPYSESSSAILAHNIQRPDYSSDKFQIVLLPPPGPQVVIAIHRTNNMSPGKKMSVPQALGALRSKYGKGVTYGNGGAPMWFFDPKDKPVAPPMAFKGSSRCYPQAYPFEEMLSLYDTDIAYNRRETGAIKERINPGCGKVLLVTFGSSNNPDVSSSLNMTLIDNATYYQALGPTRDYRISQKKI